MYFDIPTSYSLSSIICDCGRYNETVGLKFDASPDREKRQTNIMGIICLCRGTENRTERGALKGQNANVGNARKRMGEKIFEWIWETGTVAIFGC